MSVDRITQKLASSLLPGQTVWDKTVIGFGIRKQRRAAVYVFKYRQRGRQRFITIGRHGSPWTTEMARDAAKRHLWGLAEGRGPADHRDRSVPSFAEFAERYMASYAAGRKKPRSLAEDRRNLDRHILPLIGDLRLDEIGRRDIASFHTAQHSRPVNANRCLALISHIFTIAEKWDFSFPGTNPCKGIERYREKPRERFLTSNELSRLGTALEAASRGYHGYDWDRVAVGHPTGRKAPEDWRAIACYRLLLFTGARLSEILSLRWNWIDWDRGIARLPDSKTGAKILPLTEPALALLKNIENLLQEQKPVCAYVLPGNRPNTHFKGVQAPWQRIRTLAGLADIRIHDLRHSFATTAVSAGDSLYIVGAILGHKQTKTTQRYAHLATEPVREVANRTARTIAVLLQRGIALSAVPEGAP
jgi:integrase